MFQIVTSLVHSRVRRSPRHCTSSRTLGTPGFHRPTFRPGMTSRKCRRPRVRGTQCIGQHAATKRRKLSVKLRLCSSGRNYRQNAHAIIVLREKHRNRKIFVQNRRGKFNIQEGCPRYTENLSIMSKYLEQISHRCSTRI